VRARATLLAALLLLALARLADAEVVQHGPLRVSFSAGLFPRTLPRHGQAPIAVSMGGQISAAKGAKTPQLRQIQIAINRYGRLDPAALPACRLAQIQPATTEGALEACGPSLVGTGSFDAEVLLPEQSPFPSKGSVYAFNGSFHGKPAILAHVYGTEPAPTSYTLPFVIEKRAKGTFGTVLSASLPRVTAEWGYVTGLELDLRRTVTRRGPYLTAGCPAPAGFSKALFPLARTVFAFAGGREAAAALERVCHARD
jgi:hypothetical protein